MTQLAPPIDSVQISASVLQATLSQIRGLVDSRIVFDALNHPCEIHVVASNTRNPKRIIRDVETLLLVKHGLKVDYRKISLVLLDEEQLARPSALRLVLEQVVEEDFGTAKRLRVEIQGAGKRLVGAAQIGTDNPTAYQAAANATIHSIKVLLKQNAEIRLSEIQILQLKSAEIVVVVLKCFAENREENWVGSCFVTSHLTESAVRATLDALNRRIFYLI